MNIMSWFKLGHCVRSLPPANPFGPQKPLYLSFDDGPDPKGTPETLALLDRFGAKASFFVIAGAAKRHPSLVRETLAAGHGLGNHSLDHRWHAFLQSDQVLKDWILAAEDIITSISGQASVGFRSPAGVLTPPLFRVLAQLNMPLVHWQKRFFDAVWPWTKIHARYALADLEPGSIVLLHDRQREGNRERYLKTLAAFLAAAIESGFTFEALSREACLTLSKPSSYRPASSTNR
jgi:peptidoglycan/xylan/chitin deacetylase (PgdA/CDA1 family)